MAECGKYVKGYYRVARDPNEEDKWMDLNSAYPCIVEEGHVGPCASREAPQTQIARARWLQENDYKLRELSQSKSGLIGQGPAKTFSDIAEHGSMLPHPSAVAPCPVCNEDVINKELRSHLETRHQVQGTGFAAETASKHAPPDIAKGNPMGQIDGAPLYRSGIDVPDRAKLLSEPEDFFVDPQSSPPSKKAVDQAAKVSSAYPTRTDRPYDQPLPKVNAGEYIQSKVQYDIDKRLEVGIERYGTGLQAFNGRNGFEDAYEEALDLVMYWKQLVVEREDAYRRVAKIAYHLALLRDAGYDDEVLFPDKLQEDVEFLLGWLKPVDRNK